ncbi:MAG: hypothetical protein ACFFDX_08990 [Candidatus Odinarchaeota archaeon]
MKLWIIYKNGIGFSKLIAEMLQDRQEDYVDVDVGTVKKIEPTSLVEEKLDYLIIGDVISKEIPSLEIQNWLHKYWEISKKKNLILKAISGYYILLTNISVEPFWVEFLHANVKTEIIHPPVLDLKLNEANLLLEEISFELVKEYSKDFIDFVINEKSNQRQKIKK